MENYIKITFIALEFVMIVGLLMVVFLTNWSRVIESGEMLTFQTTIIVLAVGSVVFQKEQQEIEWDLGEDY